MAKPRPFRFGALAFHVLPRDAWWAYARKVEALGFSSLCMGEHIAFVSGGLVAALTSAADATTSLRLTSHMFMNDMRHPALLTQEAATIDLLSSGRLELGIGAGWFRGDYEALGRPFDSGAVRVARLAEAVRLIKRLFGDEPTSFAGEYYQVHELNVQPKPIQRPYPPIFIGGGGRRILTLAAREATIVGLDPVGTAQGTKDIQTSTGDAFAQKVAWVREAAGERFNDLELHVLVANVIVTDHQRQAAEQVAAALASLPEIAFSNTRLSPEAILQSPQNLIGTVDQIVETLQERRERYGISYVTVNDAAVDAFAPVVERLAGT
jgi:probable F420-dependent oxidoreductase